MSTIVQKFVFKRVLSTNRLLHPKNFHYYHVSSVSQRRLCQPNSLDIANEL